jgi:prepilin-type N-terminal cleavage/methylation domain-containing protein
MRHLGKGFTLVEIAIVLVIIGLLLGGILKGQEMITQAKIKNLIADFSGISAAYHGYQDRYRKLPGDDGDANARWSLGIPAPASGAYNDGTVSGTYNTTTANEESRLFWLHLRRAGFVAGNDQEQPFNAVTGKIGVQTGNAAGGTVLGGFGALIVCSANMPDKMAIAVDTQMDDGDARTGTVRGQLHTGGPNPPINAAADANNYVESGTNVYTLCRAL